MAYCIQFYTILVCVVFFGTNYGLNKSLCYLLLIQYIRSGPRLFHFIRICINRRSACVFIFSLFAYFFLLFYFILWLLFLFRCFCDTKVASWIFAFSICFQAMCFIYVVRRHQFRNFQA